MPLPPLLSHSGITAGVCLWAIAFYWFFSPQAEQIYDYLAHRWPSGVASLVGILPWVGLGLGCEYLCDWSLGKSWGVSLGLLAAVGAGVYELGRRSNRPPD